jgi:hypothetical protein
VEAVRRRPALASFTVGLITYLLVVILSPGGDLVVPTIGSIAAVGLAVAMYVALRRQRGADGDAASPALMNRDDEDAASQVRVLFRVTNPPSALLVRFEPWAHEIELNPGASHEALLTGPDQADVEVRVATNEVTVYGWAGSVLDGAGLPVPSMPSRIR